MVWDSRNDSMSEGRPVLHSAISCFLHGSRPRTASQRSISGHFLVFKNAKEGNKGPDVRRIHQISSDKERLSAERQIAAACELWNRPCPFRI